MKEFYRNLKKVYKYGKKYKVALFISIFVSIIYIILNVIVPIIAAKQIVYLSNSLYEELIYTSLVLFLLSIVSIINNAVLRYSSQIYFRGTTRDIQLDLSKEILKIEVSKLDKTNSGIFINRIGSDTNEMAKIFSSGVNKLTNIMTCIGAFLAVFIINKIVFIYYLLTVIVLCLMHVSKARSVNVHDKTKRKKKDKTMGLVSELVRGIRDIKMLNAKDNFMNAIKTSIDEYTESMFRMRNEEIKKDVKIGITSSIIDLMLIIILVNLLSKSLLTVSFALVLYNYKSKILSNFIEYIGEFLLEIKEFNLASERVFSIIENSEFKKEKFGKNHLDTIEGKIEFDNVKFGYTEKNIFNKLSFKIDANDMVAIVGKSGEGKTTIFNLLCKLYDIKSGQIKIDDNDIKELDEYSIRNNITIISQDPYIFNMSIKDNLRLVKENITDEEIKKACKLACLDDYIQTLPEKYDTIVGENGITLSGGQKQRLAIARAFVQNTKIILFDEATSSLDNETQAKIQEAINNLKNKYTIIIIAHRLTTINTANKILLLNDGKIVAEGNHKELLAHNDIYKLLYQKEIK